MHRALLVTAALLLGAPASAQHHEPGDIHVMDPWSGALPPVAPNGAVYLRLNNQGQTTDRLTGASTPVADHVEIHTHEAKGTMMMMRQVSHVDLPPGAHVGFEPGGRHLMLVGLKRPLTAGETFPLTLRFARAAPVQVTVTVVPPGAGAPATQGHAGHGHGDHAGSRPASGDGASR